MSATFDHFGFMPPDLRKHFAELEDFVGEVDGKMLCTETDENTVIDEGTVDGEEAVKAVNAIAAEIKRLLEIPAAQ